MSAAVENFEERFRDVELSTQRNADRIGSHEEICAERYKNINESLADVNRTVRWAATGLIGGMMLILVKLVFFV